MSATGRKIHRIPERAGFKPIPPDLDITELIANTPNFQLVQRVDARSIDESTLGDLKELIQSHLIEQGLPLVIENWHLREDWPMRLFNPEWLQKTHGTDCIHVRDIPKQTDIAMTMGHYLRNLNKLASKFTPEDHDGTKQRLYGKDLDCPSAWRTELSKIIPQSTFYLSPFADLMYSLPPEARAENMMCYIGHEGTYTPAHKEMCASLGHNIMLYNSEDGEKPGSSIWFMTASADRDIVAEYWLSHMGHDIEVEAHLASVQDLAAAPITVYVVEQKVGDYILVPPLAPHQVWNRGEITIKAAWNRTTVDTLELAMSEALPKAKLVCRDEQYKNKAIVYNSLRNFYRVLNNQGSSNKSIPDVTTEQLKDAFVRLFKLFDRILLDECFATDLPSPKVEQIPNEYSVTCAFCRGNIFNRFMSCKKCVFNVEGEEDMYDICMECYARGRSCCCISDLQWVEQHDWKVLLRDHEDFRSLVLEIEGAVTANSPKAFTEAYKALDRKSLARVCQEQLIARPFVDITKELESEEEEDEDDDEDSRALKKKKRKKEVRDTLNCHVCKVLSKFTWKCPQCLGICSCGACRRKSNSEPYEPKGTMLGASTKHVADPRSRESLVDFAKGNLVWLKPPEKGATPALKRKRESISSSHLSQQESSQDIKGAGESSRALEGTRGGVYPGFGDAHNNDDMGPSSGNSLIPIDPELADHGSGNASSKSATLFVDGCDDKEIPSSNISGRGAGVSFLSPCGIWNDSNQLITKQDMLHTAATADLMEENELGMDIGAGTADRTMGGRMGVINNESRQPVLPGPSAMLTGALPEDSNYHSNVYSNQPPWLANVNNPSHHYSHESSSFSGASNNFHNGQENRPIFGHEEIAAESLSELERNPMSFLEAAGLLQCGGDDLAIPAASHEESQLAPVASMGHSPISAFTYENYKEHLPSASIHPRMLMNNGYEHHDDADDLEQSVLNPGSTEDGGNNYDSMPPPKKVTRKRQRKSAASGTDAVFSDVLSEIEEPSREKIIAELFKKQKQARQRKSKAAKEKSLKVVLKISPELFKSWEEARKDIVTTDLNSVTKKRDVAEEVGTEGKRRGRPRKSDILDPASPKYPEKEKNNRRESAWARRKQEEEEAYEEYLKTREEQEKMKTVGGRIPKELAKKQKMVASREATFLMRKQMQETTDQRRASDEPQGGIENNMPFVQTFKEFKPLTPEEKAEKEKRREEQKLLRERKKAEARERKAREEAERQERKRLEEVKRQEEKKRRQEEEWERLRKEEIEKAYREAKLIAAGTAGIPISFKIENEEENQLQPFEDDNDVEIGISHEQGLLPRNMDFAIVVQTRSRGTYDWRKDYETIEEVNSENLRNVPKPRDKRKSLLVSGIDEDSPIVKRQRQRRRLVKGTPSTRSATAKASTTFTSPVDPILMATKQQISPEPAVFPRTRATPTLRVSAANQRNSSASSTSLRHTLRNCSLDGANDHDDAAEPPARGAPSVAESFGSVGKRDSLGIAAKWGAEQDDEFEWPAAEVEEGLDAEWGTLAKYRV
ncbi:hypothetical protein RUND412_009496 [Rhizina undulata]